MARSALLQRTKSLAVPRSTTSLHSILADQRRCAWCLLEPLRLPWRSQKALCRADKPDLKDHSGIPQGHVVLKYSSDRRREQYRALDSVDVRRVQNWLMSQEPRHQWVHDSNLTRVLAQASSPTCSTLLTATGCYISQQIRALPMGW